MIVDVFLGTLIISVSCILCAEGQYPAIGPGNQGVLQPPVNAQPVPVVGAPYPLPELAASPKDVIVPNQATLELDKPLTSPSPAPSAKQSRAGATGSASGGDLQPPSISVELISFLKTAVETEQRSLASLRQEISKLQAELKTARADMKKQSTDAEKKGRPDTLTLALQFPSRKMHNRKVEGIGAPTKAPVSTKAEPKNGSTTAGTGKPANSQDLTNQSLRPLAMKLLPVPVIYAAEDGRSALAQAIKNAQEVAKEEALYTEKEMKSLASSPQQPTSSTIEEAQRKLDKIVAASSYYKADADLTNEQIRTDALRT